MVKVNIFSRNPENIYDVIYPAYSFLRIIRYFNFDIKSELCDGIVESDKFDVFTVFAFVCFLCYLFCTTFYNPNPNSKSNINIIRFGYIAFLCSGILTTIIVILILFLYKKQYWKIFRSMYLFDKKMISMSYTVLYKDLYFQLLRYFLVTFVTFFVAVIIKWIYYGFDIIQILYIIAPSGNLVICFCMYTLFIMMLNQRFEILSRSFR